MSPVVDETAGDLPVRDVGLMRGGLMPTVPDNLRDVKSWKKHHVLKTKPDPQRLFRFPREHLEDLCLRLQEENSVLRQHTRTQEHRMRRMSTRLMRLRQPRPGSGGLKDRDMEDTIQELEARVAMLESQKVVLQNKLSLAKQHILDLGARTPYKYSKGKNLEGEGGVRRAAQTAPPRCGFTLEDTRTEMERLSGMTDQLRMTELELTAQTLRDTLREREKEIEGTVRELRKQQADRHRTTIRENVDVIRLQKQLSDKSAALRVSQEKFTDLQETYEKQLEESQRSLKESQGALLEKVEELTEQLKQERQRALALEGQLTTTSLSLQTLDKLEERISDLEGERDLIKENYDTLLKSTLSAQSDHDDHVEKHREKGQKRDIVVENVYSMDIQRLEKMLQAEKEERSRLELEKEKLRHEKEMLEERREQEGEFSLSMRDKQEYLEREVVQYREQVSTLQGRLDSVTKEFDMSVEELSETLVQIKAFRMQQESRESLRFLLPDGKVEDATRELVNIQASHAETVLELQKTRNLLLLEHKITKDLQEELSTINQRVEREREENTRRVAEKDKLLAKRALQINTLQAQLKELAYSPRNYKRTIPIQYTWPAGGQEVVQPIEDDLPFSQLKAGESLLEIHLKAATFTPSGLRTMGNIHPGADKNKDIVTFCTYCLLDFEMHSTPLVSGSQPNYGFTSRYALTVRDLGRLGGQGSRVRVELHQAVGGIQFVTHGSGHMSLMGAIERRGERISGRVTITGHEGEIVGMVDFWARLFPPAEPVATVAESEADRRTVTQRGPVQISLGWQDSSHEELHDYGGGIPNELVVMLERCVGLSARWPGLLPDAYLTYRFYDLPPHVSQTVQCTADPVFNDVTSYPLAVSADVLHYLRSSSLWVYVFDESDDQIPPAYLAKTPIPLLPLATGREIRGDYVLRDPAGGPRGMVRVMVKWKYPFQPSMDALHVRGERGVDEQSRVMESTAREERRKEEDPHRPVAKPRVKTQQPEPRETTGVQKETKAWPRPPVKQKSSQDLRSGKITSVKPPGTHPSIERNRSIKSSPNLYLRSPDLTPEPRPTTTSHRQTAKSSVEASSRQSPTTPSRSSVSDVRTQDLPSLEVSMVEDEEEEERSESGDSEAPESSESSSSQSDIIIIPPRRKMRKGEKLRVEILSLTFEPSSRLAMDKSVQRVYVEYRLLGVPMETTETPMSLRKPVKGEEVHYNFTRVIYVNGSQSAPLRQYLYTMLEGTDPNQGRLKFTVVSEPMDDDEECVDVGHAFLDLQELLLTGNDVIEQQIDIVSVDEDKEVIGNLKVSLEAAKALTGIYQEFHKQDESKTEDETDEEEGEAKEEEEEEEGEQEQEEKKKDQIQVLDFDDGDDNDFY
ncbi:protein fantom isoform X2 [Melanotaenia boesemani]|uniref:protein fantom isoform X2 n=1 Tax=Melanotaenia boesemani TaxID=1250792 RepID=UPI001C03EC13|nr:protein fantom isoform X2 [Melanotaenia boesemani]